jgi:hypothetical protein
VRLRVISRATSIPPEGRSAWSHTAIAAHLADTGISASQVGRILAEADLRPHKGRGWLNRLDDEQFWQLAGALCDLYLTPPDNAVLLSVDEKTGIQAKSRKHPEICARPGRAARREFEYLRHGTVSLLAAMDVRSGRSWPQGSPGSAIRGARRTRSVVQDHGTGRPQLGTGMPGFPRDHVRRERRPSRGGATNYEIGMREPGARCGLSHAAPPAMSSN